jgi:hypothetical protein
MVMNGLEHLADVLESGRSEIHADTDISRKAFICINRILSVLAQHDVNVRTSADLDEETLASNVPHSTALKPLSSHKQIDETHDSDTYGLSFTVYSG